MRLLPCIRLSVLDDQSTSPERQSEKIETFARLSDHELVPINEADYDLDVSGSISPFERPGLGPWLAEDRLNMWDAIIVAKLDRLTRSLFDFVALVSWLEARGKTLICIDPMLDLSTRDRHAFASITATFAQFERETIAARVRDAWHKLRESGNYAGGQVPFGYQPVKLDKGWGYEPEPVYGPIVAEMFDRYVRYRRWERSLAGSTRPAYRRRGTRLASGTASRSGTRCGRRQVSARSSDRGRPWEPPSRRTVRRSGIRTAWSSTAPTRWWSGTYGNAYRPV